MKSELIRNHAAVDAFAIAAESVPSGAWAARPSAEHWTPAQQVNHIVLTYRAMTHDVRDGRRAEFIGTEQQRRQWRLMGLAQIYFRGALPAGAPSPREVRPPDYSPDRATLLRELRGAVDEFERTMRSAAHNRPAHRVAHPYFGWLSLRQAVRVSTVHTRHHIAALASTLSDREAREA
jgi:hypothetical protein